MVLVILVVFDSVLVGFDIVLVVHGSGYFGCFRNVLVGFDSVFDIMLLVHGFSYFGCFRQCFGH